MTVHDCGDDGYVAFNRVDDGVGKAPRTAFAVMLSYFCPSLRVTQDTGDGALDFVQKFQS